MLINPKKYDYDDDDEPNTEVPEMRAPMDAEEANPSGPVPELQTDPVGRTIQVGTIYILETADGQFVKIGFTKRLSIRLLQHSALIRKIDGEVNLIAFFPGTFKTEARLHRHFADCRFKTEWYHREPCLAKLAALFDEPIHENREPRIRQWKPKQRRKIRPDLTLVEHLEAIASSGGKARGKKLSLKRKQAIGRKGGKIGGKARAATLKPEQRQEIARKAAAARWGKKRARSE